jgi:hypothetical protein
MGVWVALSAGCGLAAADTDSRDAGPRVDSVGSAAASAPSPPARGRSGGGRAANPPRSAASAGGGRFAGDQTAAPEAALRNDVRRDAARSPTTRVPVVADATADPASGTSRSSVTAAAADTPSTAVDTAVQPTSTEQPVTTVQPASATRPSRGSPVQWSTPVAPSARQTIAGTNLLTTATTVGLAVTNVVQFAVLMAVSALSAAPPGPFSTTPTLRLNGFDIVPMSTEEVTSLYGRWAYMPGAPGLIQGSQKFGVVDPKTGDQVGTFDALVSRGNGLGYTELLVTSGTAPTVAAAGGPVPPAGSLISNLQFGRIGFAYSALPTPSGSAVSFRVTTPFGDIRVPLPFDNAKGIADHTVDNRPMRLGYGYSIAPTDPTGETFTATSGIMPGFMTVQGHQAFSVYDPNGHPVGGFTGVFTTTADLFFYTQAVMVTANDGTNVGSGPGQVPPVGSVFNIIYFGSDDHFLLYSALPNPGGTDISVIRVNRDKVSASALALIDATAPPATRLAGAGGFEFVPASEFLPTGINGLPPREVEIQGYQQFDVYDAAGARIGRVDADVFTQWDPFGIHSTAILVTDVSQGGDDVPPAGSIFNFVSFGASGLGAAHSTVPEPSGNLTSVKLLTPVGDIRLPSTFIPAPRRTPVAFYSPFRSG